METEFIFWRHDTSAGIRVEEICGGEDKSARLWKAMALQVFGENGGDRFRDIGHLESGAPVLEDSGQRISVSHTQHFMVVAMLPRTPEADLTLFSRRAAMGIDCEEAGRRQVLRVAGRVMTPDELSITEEYARRLKDGWPNGELIPEDEAQVTAFVLAWTVKEAMYKAALTPGLDFRRDLVIEKLPGICDDPLASSPIFGKGFIRFAGGVTEALDLFSYRSEGHIVTLAYSPRCAKFKRGR